MPCDVWLMDDTLSAITAGAFEITETDHWGLKIDFKTAYPRGGGGGLGAQLISPTPPEPVKIFVDDLSGGYSPASLGELHGGLPARLDISLYPLPGAVGHAVSSGYQQRPPAAADSPRSPAEVSQLIARNAERGMWTQPEASGTRQLYQTVVTAFNSPRLDEHLIART